MAAMDSKQVASSTNRSQKLNSTALGNPLDHSLSSSLSRFRFQSVSASANSYSSRVHCISAHRASVWQQRPSGGLDTHGPARAPHQRTHVLCRTTHFIWVNRAISRRSGHADVGAD